MKNKKILNKNTVKTFVLSGLMCLMPSCKMMQNEPENPKETNKTYNMKSDSVYSQNIPVDSFMTNVSHKENLKLRSPGESDWLFTVNNSANTMTFFQDLSHESDAIENPVEFERLTNITSDSVAFAGKSYWNYYVPLSNNPNDWDYCWEISGVTDAEYFSKYYNLSDSALANVAKQHLESRNSNPYYIQNVYDAVSAGKGAWSNYQGKKYLSSLYAKSYGSKIGLKTSDIVNITFADGANEQTGSFYFSAMDDNKKVDKTAFNGVATYRGSAVASVNKQFDDETYDVRKLFTDSATLTIDAAKNETIVMPFNDWYKVTVIKSGNSIITYFDDLPSYASDWTMSGSNIGLMQQRDTIYPNGLHSSYGYDQVNINWEYNTIKDPASANKGEKTYQQIYTSTGVYSDFSSNYFMEEQEDITTGIPLVYCAPARNKSTNDNDVPTEVIVHGSRNDFDSRVIVKESIADGQGGEYDTYPYRNVPGNGIHFSFIFGGTRQR